MAAADGFVPGQDFIGTYEPDAYESVHQAFGHGGVEMIELHDFMTHHRLVVRPSARGNLIVGPNGSGKSSVVCAIILGMGGSSSTMERASSLDGFIRRGCDKARIRITLHDKDCAQPTVITRTLERRQGASGVISSYTVHQRGNQVTTKTADEVKKLAQSFGIFVDNNCQVLPQESIANFVNSAPADLLKETERAIMSGVLYDKHMALEQLQADAMRADAEVGKHLKQHSKLNETLLNYTQQLSRNENAKKFAEELEALKLSKPWLHVHDQVADLKHVKKQRKLAQKQFAEAAELLPEAEELATTTAAQFKSAFEVSKAARAVPRQARDAITSQLAALKGSLENVARFKMEVGRLANTGSGHEREVQKAERQMKKYSKRLETLLGGREPKDLKAAVTAANTRLVECEAARTDADRAARDARAAATAASTEEKNRASAVQRWKLADGQRINHVYNVLSPDVRKKLKNIETRRTTLDAQTEGPLAAAVKPKSQLACRVLNDMPFKSKLAYLCQTGADASKLRAVLDAADLKQARTFVPEAGAADSTPERIMSDAQWEDAKRMGATAQLMDEVECSGAMRVYLEANGYHRVILAPRLTRDQALDLLDKIPAGVRIATETTLFSTRRGRLSGVVSRVVNRLGEAGLFKASAASEELQRAMAAHAAAQETGKRLRAQQAASDAAFVEKTEAKMAAKQDLARCKATRTKYETLTAQYETERSRKERLEELIHNKDANERELRAKTTQFRSALCEGLRRYKALCKALRAFPDGLRDEYCSYAEHLWTQDLAGKAKARRDELQEKCDAAEREAEACAADVEKLRTKLEKTRTKAEEETGVSPKQADNKGWQTVHDTLKSLEETHAGIPMVEAFNKRYTHVIETLQELVGDADLPKKLENVRQQIEEVDQLLQEALERANGSSMEVRRQHDAWLEELKLAVERLSQQFSANCESLGVQGTIKLHEAGKVYKDYGLNLISSFHGAELTHAAAATQSGGEKSVTTILFLLAMQRSAPCPFRIIDEINQGMDETNERKVMHLIGASSMPTSEQRNALHLPPGMAGTSGKRVRPLDAALADPRGSLLDQSHHIGHQYFMLTPKLLPDLHFPDHVRIHTVFNGAAVNPQAYQTVTLTELVKRRRSAADLRTPQLPMLQLATQEQRAAAARQVHRQQVLKVRSGAKRARQSDDSEDEF